MKHPTEEELIAYREGEPIRRSEIAAHLAECAVCRTELDRVEAVLTALTMLPVPEPDENYEVRLWRSIAPQLPEKHRPWWRVEFRRWMAVGAVGALVLLAFVAGRITKRGVDPIGPEQPLTNTAQIRERVLWLAVGEHLGRSEMMLMELSNTEPQYANASLVNISAEQRRAEDLLEENRLYRQTALQEGDAALANVLDELERVLLDVAHSPEQVTSAQLQAIRQRIDAQGILFKVRVVGKELKEREQGAETAPVQDHSKDLERNKV